MSDGIVIAGGGLAAQRCAETLRRAGYEGRVRMVCGEPHAPYDRPPLSKAVLAGSEADDGLRLRPASWYGEHAVELLLGARAAALDCTRRIVTLADGHALGYEQLLIATGSRPRRLALLDGFANVHTLRTLEDARALRAALAEGGRLVIVGAGFIGQEVAAAAAKAGAHTTIVEAADAPLAALLGRELGTWFADLHRSEGVDVVLGASVAAAAGAERVECLTLTDGRRLACDHVLVGVGVDPDLAWLAGSGLDPAVVRVGAEGHTGAPGVFAAGDATGTGHWESAARQGMTAARAMLGLGSAQPAAASFWSDLYDTRVHYLGDAPRADAVSIDGDPARRDFSVTFTRAGAPVAVLLVGRPQDLPNARALLAA
ncbi:MAG TPA: FAD-dependent oxidoreductase [Solirubrobacteraceae bacterium]|nr:FAD-dependent oxidoreductase [Solirubrobacteraceae bacterium]